MEPITCYSQSSCVCMPKFKSYNYILFSGKNTILGSFLKIQKLVWPYRYAYDVPLVTLILNIYGFLGLAPLFFLEKVPLLVFFLGIQKGVCPCRYN